MKYKAIIVDDEEHCIDTLLWQLEQYCSNDVEVIGTYSKPDEALVHIISLKPDIVFTDIQMPGLSGLELAEQIENNVKHIIFTTAYDQYAIKAIKLNALDYLMKPVDRDELKAVIEKIKILHTKKELVQNNSPQELRKSKFVNKIALRNSDGMIFISLHDIIFVEADSAYSIFHMANQKKIVISKTLSYVEELLDDPGFFRVHKSFIINLNYVENYIRGDGGEIVMSNGVNIALSRSKKDEFLNIFGQW
ncbi:MAG: response regulator transcription factor [Saprospiraceae bacterium]|nr:response regulator transcription factor [Saprospiraceae bacterium]